MRILGSLVAALPLAFGLIRAATTGTDYRYLWVAIASTLSAGFMLALTRRARRPLPGIVARIAFSVFAAAGAAGMCAFALGGGSAPAVVMVAGGFAVCSGVGLTLATVARPGGDPWSR